VHCARQLSTRCRPVVVLSVQDLWVWLLHILNLHVDLGHSLFSMRGREGRGWRKQVVRRMWLWKLLLCWCWLLLYC
jgi:hypothetical protein